MNKFIVIVLCLFFLDTKAQESFTLNEVLDLAHENSIMSKKVKNSYENKYWRYFSYKRSFLPSLSFTGTLPNVDIGITEVILPNGNSEYVRRSQTSYYGELSLNQPVKWTGGNLFVRSGLSRLDLLGANGTTSYRSSPFYVGYTQPIFRFNSFKWQSKIEPLYFEEAKKLSVEQKEDVSLETVRLYFNLINNLSRYEVAELNVANSDTLYKISKGRYNLGKISESDLLQIELTLLNAKKELAQLELDVMVSKQSLKSFLGIPMERNIELELSQEIPNFKVDVIKAQELALKNRSEMVRFRRNQLEGERELDRVKKDNSFSADLFVTVGTTQTGPTLDNAYQNPIDQERVNLGITMPIFSWGLSRARIKQQKANTEFINNQVEQDRIDFEREVFIQITQFNLMQPQVEIAEKSMVVAKKRYEVAKQRYLIGKSDIFTFNNSLKERNEAINAYNQTLQQFWVYYYLIRKLTHYDFENGVPIVEEGS